jgi:hypothetical protein
MRLLGIVGIVEALRAALRRQPALLVANPARRELEYIARRPIEHDGILLARKLRNVLRAGDVESI